jgi:hypothetical protein
VTELVCPQSNDIPGSWSFSVRTRFGRVIACVPNTVLCSCFGARSEEELFRVFTGQIQLLHNAARVRLEKGFCPLVEIEESDIAAALKRMH